MHDINFEFFMPFKATAKDKFAHKFYITYLGSDVEPIDLRKIFETVGVVLDAKIVKTATSVEPIGLGYIEIGNQFDFGRAFKELNGKKIKGCHNKTF